jgi:hypothetical protein
MIEEEKIEVEELTKGISREFEKSGLHGLIRSANFDDYNALREYLTNKLADLMDKDLSYVINTLYRIDVDEEKVRKLFSPDNKDFIPEVLADLIINRELQKINFRRRYKEDQNILLPQ